MNASPDYRLRQAFLFALFVFLFLLVFKPFQIDGLGGNLLLAAAGFGGVTFIAMILLNLLIPKLFKAYFDEENWTVGKEIFYTLLNLWLIGLFNFLFFNFFFGNNFSLQSFWWFQFITVAVGVFPVVFITFFREKISRNKYVSEADNLSGALNLTDPGRGNTETTVTIPSQTMDEDFTIALSNLYYVKAADNYIEVHYRNGKLQKKMLRNTLKRVDELLSSHEQMFRCHKSYMVNLHYVEKVTGNAQGYRLHLKDIETPVPVSRQYNDQIKKMLAVRP